MSTTVPSSLVNTPKTNTSCNGSDLVESPAQEVCGSTVYVGDVAAGLEAIQVDESQVDGVVVLQGAGGTTISLSGQTVTVSSQSTASAQKLADLTDVALSYDIEGNPIFPEDSFLKFQDHTGGLFWTASDTLDGGSY